MALRRRVATLDVAPIPRSVFDDIRVVHALALRHGSALPVDLAWMLRSLELAEEKIAAAGYDPEFCHGDGNVSNVLVGPYGLRLVDWDLSGMMDPIQDLGCLLAELGPFDLDARELFEASWGCWDPRLFDRARVYGVADQVRHGLIGAYRDAREPGTLEYAKFSDWQFLRARTALNDPRFDDRMRNL